MKTHRDDLLRFSARSVRRGDAGHREPCATMSVRASWRPKASAGRRSGRVCGPSECVGKF